MKMLLATTALAALASLPAGAQQAPADPVLAVFDLNADGVIDAVDLSLADTNADGIVDASDSAMTAEATPDTGAAVVPDLAEGDAAPVGIEDADADGVPDASAEATAGLGTGIDANGDGIADDLAAAPDTLATDTNGDGVPDSEVAAGDAAVPGAATVGGVDAASLDGERVYDADDRWIGEIGEIVVAGGQTIAIVDVGGFLGIGEKPVALNLDELEVTTDETGDVRVSVAMTKEQLEAMPSYE